LPHAREKAELGKIREAYMQEHGPVPNSGSAWASLAQYFPLSAAQVGAISLLVLTAVAISTDTPNHQPEAPDHVSQPEDDGKQAADTQPKMPPDVALPAKPNQTVKLIVAPFEVGDVTLSPSQQKNLETQLDQILVHPRYESLLPACISISGYADNTNIVENPDPKVIEHMIAQAVLEPGETPTHEHFALSRAHSVKAVMETLSPNADYGDTTFQVGERENDAKMRDAHVKILMVDYRSQAKGCPSST